MKTWFAANYHALLFLLCVIPGGVIFVLIAMLIGRSRPSEGPNNLKSNES